MARDAHELDAAAARAEVTVQGKSTASVVGDVRGAAFVSGAVAAVVVEPAGAGMVVS